MLCFCGESEVTRFAWKPNQGGKTTTRAFGGDFEVTRLFGPCIEVARQPCSLETAIARLVR